MRTEIIYAGRVQGVGFRFTAEAVARRFEIAGFVRNNADRTVTLQAQGEPDEVRRFFAAMREEAPGRIDSESALDLPDDPDLTGFHIRR